MKARTLPQPDASLVALGVKTMLDTSWPCPPSLIGQPLAIHAGAKFVGNLADPLVNGCHFGEGTRYVTKRDLPLGAVVATCRVAACVPMVSWAPLDGPAVWAAHMIPLPDSGAERMLLLRDARSAAECADRDGPLPAEIDISDQLPYGDFHPGRYAWLLQDVKPTTERCPACWGEREVPVTFMPGNRYQRCPLCNGAGHCPPLPARGRQRVWNWTP